MSTARALLVLTTTLSYQFAVSSQEASPNAWETVTKVNTRPSPLIRVGSLLSNVSRASGAFHANSLPSDGCETHGDIQVLIWQAAASEVLFIYAAKSTSSRFQNVISLLCPEGPLQQSATYVSPALITSVILAGTGAALRIVSTRSLDMLYNSSTDLRLSHRLVTNGPYSYIRHPGYAGSILGVSGAAVCFLTKGSWARECGILQTRGKWVFAAWLTWSCLWLAGLFVRARKEDDILKKRFGVEWKHWQWEVPKWFVPGIF